MAFDLIDDPNYEPQGLSVSTAEAPKGTPRLMKRFYRWGVYYHGRLLHPGLSNPAEAKAVSQMYAEGVSSWSTRWDMLTTPGKHPSPSTDHRRKAGVIS